jgi:hypothetical protein
MLFRKPVPFSALDDAQLVVRVQFVSPCPTNDHEFESRRSNARRQSPRIQTTNSSSRQPTENQNHLKRLTRRSGQQSQQEGEADEYVEAASQRKDRRRSSTSSSSPSSTATTANSTPSTRSVLSFSLSAKTNAYTHSQHEISAQISELYKDTPDLRADFHIFMPDRSQQSHPDPDLYPHTQDSRPRSGTPMILDAKVPRRRYDHPDPLYPPKRKRRAPDDSLLASTARTVHTKVSPFSCSIPPSFLTLR